MIDSTVAHIIDPQFKMKVGEAKQYGDAYSGLFYWIREPACFAERTQPRDCGDEWNWGACIVDDFGVLHPADFFYYGWDAEQTDDICSYFLLGLSFGAFIESVERLNDVRNVYGRVIVVDEYFNVYCIDDGWHVSNGDVLLMLLKRGPWGHVKDRLFFNEIPESQMQYLCY